MKTFVALVGASLAIAAGPQLLGHALARSLEPVTTLRLAQAGLGTARPSNYEERPFEDVDSASTPEQKLGEFIKRSWYTNPSGCEPAQPYKERVACTERAGYSLSIHYPAACQMTVTERQPAPLNLKRRWDGSVEGAYLMARETSFDLTALKEDAITTNPIVRLQFRLSRAKMPTVRVLASINPKEWITLVPPPIEDDFAAELPDPALREQAFSLAAGEWTQKIAPFSRFQSDQGMFELTPRSFTLSMHPMAMLWWSPTDGGALTRAAQGRFTDTLKAVLAKCGGE